MKEVRVELVNELIASLRGTCKSIYDFHDEHDLSLEEFQMIDDEIFNCDVCGWWCEISEMGDEQSVCDDCCSQRD